MPHLLVANFHLAAHRESTFRYQLGVGPSNGPLHRALQHAHGVVGAMALRVDVPGELGRTPRPSCVSPR